MSPQSTDDSPQKWTTVQKGFENVDQLNGNAKRVLKMFVSSFVLLLSGIGDAPFGLREDDGTKGILKSS